MPDPKSGPTHRPRRAVLFVPAANEKALAKLPSLACDAVIFDLEDSVAPEAKAAARERLRAWFSARRKDGPECVIRVNPLASEWGTDDLLAARACAPDAILLPKVDTPRDIHDFDDALDEADAPENLKLWIMIETPKAMLNIGAHRRARPRPGGAARLLRRRTPTTSSRIPACWLTPDRRYLVPWLMQMVLAARAGGLDVLDGVSNDFRDLDAFAPRMRRGRGHGVRRQDADPSRADRACAQGVFAIGRGGCGGRGDPSPPSPCPKTPARASSRSAAGWSSGCILPRPNGCWRVQADCKEQIDEALPFSVRTR